MDPKEEAEYYQFAETGSTYTGPVYEPTDADLDSGKTEEFSQNRN